MLSMSLPTTSKLKSEKSDAVVATGGNHRLVGRARLDRLSSAADEHIEIIEREHARVGEPHRVFALRETEPRAVHHRDQPDRGVAGADARVGGAGFAENAGEIRRHIAV